jgi:hypothetical protein
MKCTQLMNRNISFVKYRFHLLIKWWCPFLFSKNESNKLDEFKQGHIRSLALSNVSSMWHKDNSCSSYFKNFKYDNYANIKCAPVLKLNILPPKKLQFVILWDNYLDAVALILMSLYIVKQLFEIILWSIKRDKTIKKRTKALNIIYYLVLQYYHYMIILATVP